MMNRSHAFILGLLLSGLLSSCGGKQDQTAGQGDISSNFLTTWADSSYWDDGKAEVAKYDAVRNIYKKDRSYELTLITVSEDFNEAFKVKTDDYTRKDLYKVMKVNAFARIETDNYPYHFLSSFFILRRDPLSLHKATLSSQEWCGNTYKEFLQHGSGYELKYSSYWDNEGSGSKNVESNEQLLFEDQLIYSLRTLDFKKNPDMKVSILSSQVGNKLGKQHIYAGRISSTELDSTWRVEVQLEAGKQNVYEFEKNYPNIPVAMNTWDGQRLRLRSRSRYEYWK